MKKIAALSLSAISYLSFAPSALAVGFGNITLCDPTDRGGLNFGALCNVGAEGVGGIITAIINILFIVALILAVGFLVYGGIKWIISGGDKAKVEAARGAIVAALVGLVLVFLSYFIINFLATFFGIGSLTSGAINIPTINP